MRKLGHVPVHRGPRRTSAFMRRPLPPSRFPHMASMGSCRRSIATPTLGDGPGGEPPALASSTPNTVGDVRSPRMLAALGSKVDPSPRTLETTHPTTPHLTSPEIKPAKICPTLLKPAQLKSTQAHSTQLDSAPRSATTLISKQGNTIQRNTVQDTARQRNPAHPSAKRLNSTQLSATRLNPIQSNPSQLDPNSDRPKSTQYRLW